MHILSVKELRENFPTIRSELEKGETFLLIHKSKPFGIIKPMNETDMEIVDKNEKELSEAWQQAGADDVLKHIPPLTKAEYDYYMSLAPQK